MSAERLAWWLLAFALFAACATATYVRTVLPINECVEQGYTYEECLEGGTLVE